MNTDQFLKEVDQHHNENIQRAEVSVSQKHNATKDCKEGKELDKALKQESENLEIGINLIDYKFTLLMPNGDCNLDQIYCSEQPSEATIRGFLVAIGEGLHCQLKQIIIVQNVVIMEVIV